LKPGFGRVFFILNLAVNACGIYSGQYARREKTVVPSRTRAMRHLQRAAHAALALLRVC
jgi:hypothetical protein